LFALCAVGSFSSHLWHIIRKFAGKRWASSAMSVHIATAYTHCWKWMLTSGRVQLHELQVRGQLEQVLPWQKGYATTSIGWRMEFLK
jgi:hypothetical protein